MRRQIFTLRMIGAVMAVRTVKMKLITLFLILFAGVATAQNNALTRVPPPAFSFYWTQDVKLATVGDDKGNTPFTPDMVIRGHVNGYVSPGLNYLFAGLRYNYADLAGGAYNRAGLEAGYSFNLISTGGIYNNRSLIRLQPFVGWGFLWRGSTSANDSFEVGADLVWNVTEVFRILISGHHTERWELDKWVYSFHAGIGININ